MLVQACFEELRIAYEGAFGRLNREVRLLDESKRQGDSCVAEKQRRRMEEAEIAYRQTRDELADYLMAQRPKAAAACQST